MLTRYHHSANNDPNESHALFILYRTGFTVLEGNPKEVLEAYLAAEQGIGAGTFGNRIIAVYHYDGIGDLLQAHTEATH